MPSINFLFLAKILTLVLVSLYIVFTFVVFNQIKTMDRLVRYPQEQVIELLGLAHMFVAITLFVIGLVIL